MGRSLVENSIEDVLWDDRSTGDIMRGSVNFQADVLAAQAEAEEVAKELAKQDIRWMKQLNGKFQLTGCSFLWGLFMLTALCLMNVHDAEELLVRTLSHNKSQSLRDQDQLHSNATNYSEAQGSCWHQDKCLVVAIAIVGLLLIEKLSSRWADKKLDQLEESLTQRNSRCGVVWTRIVDGTEKKINVWQHCKNDDERRTQKLYLAFQATLRQQGRLNNCMQLDPNSEYDVQVSQPGRA